MDGSSAATLVFLVPFFLASNLTEYFVVRSMVEMPKGSPPNLTYPRVRIAARTVNDKVRPDVYRLASLLIRAPRALVSCQRPLFLGKSPCAPDIRSRFSDFSLRLDKTQDLTLLYRNLSRVKIVMIVQPAGDTEHCGVICDLIQITHVAKTLSFAALTLKHPPT